MLALDRHKEWDEQMQKSLKSLEYTSEVHTPADKYKVGATAHVNIEGMGEVDFEITESLENEKMTIHVKKPGTNQTAGVMTFTLEPLEKETKFTCIFDYQMPWGIFGKFLDTLFARRMEGKHIEDCLAKLKSILEK